MINRSTNELHNYNKQSLQIKWPMTCNDYLDNYFSLHNKVTGNYN